MHETLFFPFLQEFWNSVC